MTVSVAPTERDVVSIVGTDAAAYLQGQLSQDLDGLGVGDSAWTFVLSPQGKVDGWGRVHRVDAEAYELDVDPGAGADVAARLQRFLLRTKAEVTVEERVPAVAVRGQVPDGTLPDTFLPVGGLGIVGGDVLRAKVDALPDDVLDGAARLDEVGVDAVRIRAGIPVWGSEIDHDTIPATLGQRVIDASVSFTKGCFTGQELVARIDSRGGHVPRRLSGVTADGRLHRGDAIVVDGRDVGTVTSAATDPRDGQLVGLAFVQRGVELPADATAADAPVRLVELPISGD